HRGRPERTRPRLLPDRPSALPERRRARHRRQQSAERAHRLCQGGGGARRASLPARGDHRGDTADERGTGCLSVRLAQPAPGGPIAASLERAVQQVIADTVPEGKRGAVVAVADTERAYVALAYRGGDTWQVAAWAEKAHDGPEIAGGLGV